MQGVVTRATAKSATSESASVFEQPSSFAEFIECTTDKVGKTRMMRPRTPQTGEPEPKKEETMEEKWTNMFQSLNSVISNLTTEVTSLKKVTGNYGLFTEQWKNEIDSHVRVSEDSITNQDFKIKWLTNVIIKQEERIESLEKKLTVIRARELRPNLIISGLVFKDQETREKLKELVITFFREKMEIEDTIEIDDVEQIGEKFNRAVKVKLKYPNDKKVIFSNASNLKGKLNIKNRKYFV